MEPHVLILLVEDESLIAMSIQEALEDDGFAVHSVTSGEDAMTALDAVDRDFSGIITDVRLGAGPNGWDVGRHARELHPSMPVVYMTGDSAADHGARGVPDSLMVQKPFAAIQLVTAIATLLNRVPPAGV